MRIHTRIIYQWDGERYVEVHEEGYNCPENGQLALCKGATQQQNDLADSQSKFYTTMTQDYNTQFANQSNVLKSLQSSLQPVLDAGINQFGFNDAENNALKSQAIQNTGVQYQNAQKSLQNMQAARGGGNAFLPSGVDSQVDAQLAASGANQTSSQLLGIKQAGYDQGRQNYQNAVASLGGVASQYNPTGFSNSATGAGSLADNQASTVQKANQAASPWGAIGGLLGGVAGSFLGPIGTQIGSKVGSSLGGIASGSGSGGFLTDNPGA